MELWMGVLLGAGTMLLWGVSDTLVRIPVKAVGAHQSLFYNRILMFAYLLVFSLFLPAPQMAAWQIGALMLLSIVFIGAKYAVLKAINIGNISTALPIANSWGAPGAILAAIVLGETLPLPAIPLIVAVLAGVFLASMKEIHSLKVSVEAPFAFAAMLGCTISYTGIAYFALGLGPVYPNLILEGFMLLWLLIAHITTEHKLRVVPRYFGITCVSALLFVLGVVLFSTSPAYGVAAVAIPLATASPAVVAVLARIFYKERLLLHQLVGIGLMILGIVALAIV